MSKWKRALVFALCLLPVAIVGGIFVGLYQMDIYPEEIFAEAIAQVGSVEAMLLIVALQTAGYALFCGLFGYLLADAVGLWKPLRWEPRSFLITLAVSLVGGVLFSLDHWTFGSVIEGVQEGNLQALSVNGVIASVLYGGVMEEVMLRLFFLSLLAFVLWKVFFRKYPRERIPTCVFIIANVIAAILFAAAHLPATAVSFGELTPLLLFRCFLFNGGFGLVFGWLYRKYGIAYAMMGHALFHVVCKTVLLIFA